MNPPIRLNFDYKPYRRADGIVHLLKIYQGAPYDQKISLESEDGTYVRDFSGYDEIRMQIRAAQSAAVLLELTQSQGQVIGMADGVRIVFPAALTETLQLGMPDSFGINEVHFVHDIELINGGVVVERLAQGEGYIVVNTTR